MIIICCYFHQWKNRSNIGSFQIPSVEGKGVYILDGYQRVSSIFGCLTNPAKTSLPCDNDDWQSLFNLYYDLEDESFVYLRTGAYPFPYQVPVHILMSTSDFRQYSRKNIENSGIPADVVDIYLDRADAISSRLLSYQVACIEITNANIEEAVDIFARINSRGTDISFDWMVNALSYDENDKFKFADLIDELKEELREYNFDGISRNTLFRCYQSAFGKLYIDQTDIENLARRPDFASVASELGQYIVKAVKFLHDDFIKTFKISICSGFFGYLIQSLTDNTWYNYRIVFLFWFMIGVANIAFDSSKLNTWGRFKFLQHKHLN